MNIKWRRRNNVFWSGFCSHFRPSFVFLDRLTTQSCLGMVWPAAIFISYRSSYIQPVVQSMDSWTARCMACWPRRCTWVAFWISQLVSDMALFIHVLLVICSAADLCLIQYRAFERNLHWLCSLTRAVLVDIQGILCKIMTTFAQNLEILFRETDRLGKLVH